MSDNKFFFITICYNNLTGLQHTINSLLSQVYSNWECLIVDGDSKDGTKEYISNINHKNVKFISEKDRGIYDAMNKGIAAIPKDSDYFCFLNSGDSLYTDKVLAELNLKIQAITEEKPKIVYGHTCESFSDGKEILKPASTKIALEKGMFCHHQSMFFHKSLSILKYNLSYRLSADYDYIIRAVQSLKHTNDMALVDMVISRFDMTGASNSQRIKGIKEDFKLRINNGLCSSTKSAFYGIRSLSLMYLKRLSYPLYMLMRSKTTFTNQTTC